MILCPVRGKTFTIKGEKNRDLQDEGPKDEKQESRVNAVSGCENSDGGNEKQQVDRRIKRGYLVRTRGS